MNSGIKAVAGLLLGAAIHSAYAAPDITFQTIPFNMGKAMESYPTLSADGRYVTFKIQSQTGAPFSPSEIAVQDLVTGQRVPGNLTLGGAVPPAGAVCNYPAMSATGRYVLSGCMASYMGGSTASGWGYFVFDRETNTTQMIPDTGSDRPGNYGSAISSDGRFVAFRTMTAGYVSKIFVRDLVNKTTSSTNAQLVQTAVTRMAISTDGRYIAYLGTAVTNSGMMTTEVYDRVTGTTEMIDVRPDGTHSTTTGSTEVSMSDDGSVVVFLSNDRALATVTPYGSLTGVYVRDRKAGRTDMISNTINSQIKYAGISGNGRYVGYTQGQELYVFDRLTKLTRKVPLGGLLAYGSPRFSTDGRYISIPTSNTALTLQSVTVADLGPAANVVLSGSTLSLMEGGDAGTYSVVLNQPPDADVKVALATSAQLTLARNQLTFTPSNWNTPQIVSVQAVADGVTEGQHSASITHTVASSDANFNVVHPADVTVTITDGVVPTMLIPGANWNRSDLPLTGVAAPNATVMLTANNRSTGWMSSVSTVADASGAWSYTLTGLTNGVVELDAQANGLHGALQTVTIALEPIVVE